MLMQPPKITLINDDCMNQLPQIADKSIDMILADLPYGVTKNKKDIPINLTLLWEQYKRIIKENGVIVLFGQGGFYIDLINSNRKWFKYEYVWDKVLTSNFLNAKRMPLRQHEQIAIFYNKPPTYNPQFTQGKPLHGRGVAYKNKKSKNFNYDDYGTIDDVRKGSTDKYPTSIVCFAKPHPSVAKHRTEKPVELCAWLIRTYTNEGDMVLDNVMGAGSTIIAALQSNRNAIGIEQDKEIFETAKKRIEEEASYANNL